MRKASRSHTVKFLCGSVRAVGIVVTAITLWLLAFVAPSAGQIPRDVLTDQQTEDLRAHADQPVEKLKLYVEYIEQRTAAIHRWSGDPTAPNRRANIHDLYRQFTELSDELEDNMDSFDDQHEDVRKAVKLIADKTEKWPSALNEPNADAAYDFVRKAALDACQSVHDDATNILEEQEKYFATHKKDKNSGG